jgi:hypothetical protein
MKLRILYFLILSNILLIFNLQGQTIDFNYLSPFPGSYYLNPEQSIILKTGYPFDPVSVEKAEIMIEGSLSGMHDYTCVFSDDLTTLVLIPVTPFDYGEMVSVQVPHGMKIIDGSSIAATDFAFKIRTEDNLAYQIQFNRRRFEMQESTGGNLPGVQAKSLLATMNSIPSDYPSPQMVNYEETDDRYFFFTLTPRAANQQYKHFLSINDIYGIPLYFKMLPYTSLYFHKMPDGNLAYSRREFDNPVNEKYYLMDSSYMVVDSVRTGNGYNMDGHDILLMENGHYLVMSYDPQPVDMSQVVQGGDPEAIVVGLIIQEVDNNEIVYWQWRSWDHFEITDATDDINLLGDYIDYVHGNAFEFDQGGDLLLSSRHLDEITKIDWETGEVIWRFGLLAKNNEFTILNDPWGFSHQHDVRVLPNGNITIYDNGNLKSYQFSQALEYEINELTMTATLVWDYRHQPDVYAPATGSYRRADDDKNLIGWGATWPLAATEVLEDGTETLEVFLPDGVSSYRVIKSDWETNLFTAPDQLHFGNYEGHNGPKLAIVPVENNSESQIKITGTHNHQSVFSVVDNLPLIIPPGGVIDLTVSYLPDSLGEYHDRLTLNYDKFNLTATERIARQVMINGVWDITLPAVSYLPDFGTIGVDPGTEVTVIFSEPVVRFGGNPIQNSDIPNMFNFRLSNQWGDEVPFTGTVSDDRQQITLFPDQTLSEEQQYFVKLKPLAVQDDDGNVIGYPETTVFTTGLFVGMDQPGEFDDLMIYPMPFMEHLFVYNKLGALGHVQLFDQSGRVLYSNETTSERLRINTSTMAPGVYFMKCTNPEGRTAIRKLVKSPSY